MQQVQLHKKTNWRFNLITLVMLSALPFSHQLYAAADTAGGITGEVNDASGKDLASATVKILNKDTGLSRTVTTDELGIFRFNKLPIGRYVIQASKDGFNASGDSELIVTVGGNAHIEFNLNSESVEVIQVSGTRISKIDTSSTDTGLAISMEQIERLPVGRNATDVALLAPGTAKGDAAFGNLASFGGASVAENVYYVNGLNITNFRNGLGGNEVPFEFFEEFQVKTGGYSAEFGRSTGGVINAVTKSGTNEFHAGANLYYSPAALSSNAPNSRNADGSYVVHNSMDETDDIDANFEVSGAIVQDKLFYYALFNPQVSKSKDYSESYLYEKSDTSDAFWGLKLDYLINDYHRLEFTGFSDKRSVDYSIQDWDPDSNELSGDSRTATSERGGINMALKYTGQINEDFTVSALVGRTQNDLTDSSPQDSNPVVWYTNDGANYQPLGNWANEYKTQADDERQVARIDFEWYTDLATWRFGLDSEKLNSAHNESLSGDRWYDIQDYAPNEFSDTDPYYLVYHESIFGNFDTKSQAMYLESLWQLGDVHLNLGLRNEGFENNNAYGERFIKIDNQLAPRLGASWDINGDGSSKLYANWGRYFLPVANILNIKLASAYYSDEQRFVYSGVDADGVPIPGAALDELFVQFDGEVANPLEVVNQNVEAMYQDEFILGYGTELGERWSASVKFVDRDLKRAIEDSTPCLPLDKIALERYGIEDYCSNYATPYVLTNPGDGMAFYHDFGEGDGLEFFEFSAEELGYPELKRRYRSIELGLDRSWDDQWSLSASYTLAKSYGNYEGSVRSDFSTAEPNAGFTTAWDFPSLLEHGSGYLPNDHRHTLKLWGTYRLAEHWIMGFNWQSQSGAPFSFYGYHPTDANAQIYEAASFYENGLPAARGSKGRTDWNHNLDLSVEYSARVGNYDLRFVTEVFNVLDSNAVLGVYEEGELDGGLPDVNYGFPVSYQTPRSVRLSFHVEF